MYEHVRIGNACTYRRTHARARVHRYVIQNLHARMGKLVFLDVRIRQLTFLQAAKQASKSVFTRLRAHVGGCSNQLLDYTHYTQRLRVRGV